MMAIMTRSISAREANQRFSDILGRAAQGESIVITRRGEPVAQLSPYTGPPKQSLAFARLVTILDAGIPLGGKTFSRDELYDR
jgi:prevent-host-death family protein